MDEQTTSTPLPDFFLLTGFLGSGKTTLVLDLLEDPEFSNTGVIVNDVGQLNIDGALVESSDTGLQVAMLTNGCVCCSLMGDLPITIAALFDDNEQRGRPPFKRLILEASGLSRPAPIIRSLLGLPVPFRITVLSTYDVLNGSLSSANYEEAAAQVAAAQVVVLTKLDQADDAEIEQARQNIRSLNPFARLVEQVSPQKRATQAFDPSSGLRELDISGLDRAFMERPGLSHQRTKVFLARFDAAPGYYELVEWLENLAGFCGQRLLRTKGLVCLDGIEGRLLVQSVGTVFDPPRHLDISIDLESAVVIIARDVPIAELDAVPGDVSVTITELGSSAPTFRLPSQYHEPDL